jgi:hypothetical protein
MTIHNRRRTVVVGEVKNGFKRVWCITGASRATLKVLAGKNAYVTEETETWKALSASTDFSA